METINYLIYCFPIKKTKIKIFYKLIIKFSILLINLFFFLIITFRMGFELKILICTVAKQENRYIKEFVNHYKKMKIKKIIIYDNNDIKGENFQDILKEDIQINFVEIINYRGIERPQKKALNDCYKKNNKNFNWIAFFDVDEFLYIVNYTNINDFLVLPKFKKCQSILINWKYYGDNNKLYYEPKPLIERFTKPFYFTNKNKPKHYFCAAKTIVRGGLNIKWGLLPHYIKNTINCKADGKIINNYFSPPQFSLAYINHYITKSTEEFAERLKRGDVIKKINDNYIRKRINNYYFIFNTKTKEKIELLNAKVQYRNNTIK